MVLVSVLGVQSLSNSDGETPEQKRERILADSRKISMPIRPVGRPRKDKADFYKKAERACQINASASSFQNIFDLENDVDSINIEEMHPAIITKPMGNKVTQSKGI